MHDGSKPEANAMQMHPTCNANRMTRADANLHLHLQRKKLALPSLNHAREEIPAIRRTALGLFDGRTAA